MTNIPLVCFNDIGNHLEQVYNSNEGKGIRMTVEYLLQHHHTRIGLLSVQEIPGNLYTHLRCKAFWDITESLGIGNSCYVYFFQMSFHPKGCKTSSEAKMYRVNRNGRKFRTRSDIWSFPSGQTDSREYFSNYPWNTIFSFLYSKAHDDRTGLSPLAEASFDLLEKMMHREKDLSDREIGYKQIVRESVRDLFQTESDPVTFPQ